MIQNHPSLSFIMSDSFLSNRQAGPAKRRKNRNKKLAARRKEAEIHHECFSIEKQFSVNRGASKKAISYQ
ncbi:MAG: hypothetical protein AAB676_12005 [Verrucomicrobiota bacterium]